MMSIEAALATLTEAVNRNTAALEQNASAGGAVSNDKPASKTAAAEKPASKGAAEKPATKGAAKPATKPAENKEVSIEDAAATATAFLGIDDAAERTRRKAWVVRLVASLGHEKVREIDDAENRAIFVRLVEQATATEKKGVVTLPVLDDGLDEQEDDV